MNKGLKITALLFLMLAGTCIAAHAVFCHHHTDDIQPVAQCDHETPCHGDIGDCALENIYIEPYKCCRTFLQHHCDFKLPLCYLTPFSDDAIPQIADISLPFRQNPLLPSYLSEYISQSLGLRAPPVC